MRAIGLLFLLAATGAANESSLAKAQELFDQKSYAQAAVLLEKALKEDPERADVHALLGHAYFELGRDAAARAAFGRAVARGHLTADVLARLGQIALREKRLPDAASSLRLAALLAPEDSALALAAASAAERAGLFAEAESEYRGLLTADPSRADVFVRLGNLYLRTKRPDKALPALVTAYHLGSSTAPLARTIAELYVSRRDLESAVRWYGRLLLLDPTNAEALRLRCARLQAAVGDVDGARKNAETLTKSKTPALAGDAHLLLGRLAASEKEIDAAMRHFQAAAKAGRADLQVHAWLGAHFRNTGNHAEAVRHLRMRLAEGPMDQSLVRSLVQSLIALQDLEGARHELLGMVEHFGMDSHAEALASKIARAQRAQAPKDG